MTWLPGEVAVYRSRASDGRFYSGLPLTVLEDTPARVVGILPHGTVVSRPVAADGRDLRTLPVGERWGPRAARLSPFIVPGGAGRVVILFPRGCAHSIWIFRGPGEVIGWYVNLEDPQVFAGRTITTRDSILDLWVPAGPGEPVWKDEDELAAAVELGLRTREEAAAYRAEGERVLRERPWPTGLEDTELDPAWPAPELFAGWDVA